MKNKSFQDLNKVFPELLSEAYQSIKNREQKVNELLEKILPMVENKGDAVIIVPLIRGYIEQGVKIDDNLIKLAAIVQRAMNNANKDNEPTLSDNDIEDLYKQAKQINIKISKE